MNDRKISRRTSKILDRFYMGRDFKIRNHPLLLFSIFGIFGVLIDADHLISPHIKVIRPLHIPYLIFIWCVFICYCTYVYRCIYRIGIGDRNKKINN